MGKSIQCSNCGADATVHLTQIINNKIIKVDLCEYCAQSKGVTDPEGFSLAELLNKTHGGGPAGDPQLKCPDCGLSTAVFRKTGRLGCSSCFPIFAEILRPALEDMHMGTQHQGKVPECALSRRDFHKKLEALETALDAAVAEEAYEEAARLRDQIREMEAALSTREALQA